MQSLSDPEALVEDDAVSFREQTAVVDDDRFETIRERAETKAGVAVVGITNDDGELLLVKTDWSDGWVLPGYSIEPGDDWVETAESAAERQTGLEIEIERVARVNRRFYKKEASDEQFSSGYAVVFMGTPTDDTQSLDSVTPTCEEIVDRDWFDKSPDNVDPGKESELWLFVN